MIGVNLEKRVQLVRQYIYDKKGVDIGNINLKTNEDLQKFDHCYNVAKDFYFGQMYEVNL